MASRKPSGRPRRPDARPTDTPAPRPAKALAGAPGGGKRSSGQIARGRASAAGAGFVALLAVVGIGSYLGRDKSDNTDVIAGAIVPPVEQTTPTTAAPPPTTTAPLVDTTSPPLIY